MAETKFWICDVCGQPIRRPEDGWVEWIAHCHGGRQAAICGLCTIALQAQCLEDASSTDEENTREMGDHLVISLLQNSLDQAASCGCWPSSQMKQSQLKRH